jgi:hypothetical protein
MGRIAVDAADLRLHCDVLARHAHPFCAIEDRAAQRPAGLEADEQHRRLPAPQIVPQVMADPARLAHAGSGKDDRPRRLVEAPRFLHAGDKMERGMPEHLAIAHVLQLARMVGENCVARLASGESMNTRG